MYRPIGYTGITRTEAWPYPLPAIREAVLNAIVHNDYSSHVPIQIKVAADSLTIYNEGNLPSGWTVDRLMGQHKSLPRNPSLATVFYRAGSIEAFGRGIGKIMAQYEDRPEFMPVFESGAGFSVTFRNEAPFHEAVSQKGVSDERGSVLDYLIEKGPGTYEEIAEGTGLSIRQVQRIAKKLLDNGAIRKEKKGRRAFLRISERTKG